MHVQSVQIYCFSLSNMQICDVLVASSSWLRKCTRCTCIFYLLTFWRRSRSFFRELTYFAVVLFTFVDDVSVWWQKFNFVFLSLKRWFQFNSWVVRTHFATMMTLNNSEMTAETRSYIYRWRSRCRRRRVCVNSLFTSGDGHEKSTSLRQAQDRSRSPPTSLRLRMLHFLVQVLRVRTS